MALPQTTRTRWLTLIFSDEPPQVDDADNVCSVLIKNYNPLITDVEEFMLLKNLMLVFLDSQKKVMQVQLANVEPPSEAIN